MSDAITIVPNEPSDVSDNVEPDSESTGIKFNDFKAVEMLVNEYAKSLAMKYRVDPSSFTIHLVSKFGGIMGVLAGEHAQVTLQWPAAYPHLNTILKDVFFALHRPGIRRSMSLVPMALIKSHDVENRKMYRQAFGDVGEIIPDLIPRQRLRVTVETITTLTDTKTGEKVTVSHLDKPTRYDGSMIGLWLGLSRVVRDAHQEAIEKDDDVETLDVQHG